MTVHFTNDVDKLYQALLDAEVEYRRAQSNLRETQTKSNDGEVDYSRFIPAFEKTVVQARNHLALLYVNCNFLFEPNGNYPTTKSGFKQWLEERNIHAAPYFGNDDGVLPNHPTNVTRVLLLQSHVQNTARQHLSEEQRRQLLLP